MNYLPTAYAAPKEYRDLRLYTRHRNWLIKHRTQAKNRVQAVLASYNLVSPVSDLFGNKGRECLEEVMGEMRPTYRAENNGLTTYIDPKDGNGGL